MTPGITITVADPDQDYLGIEIYAASDRFAGTTRVFAGLTELSAFAERIAGFPKSGQDRRVFEFGSRDPAVAGGFCSITFRCLDRRGHVAVDISLEDDNGLYGPATAQLGFETEPAAIDRFTESLRALENERGGSAVLVSDRP